MFTLIHELYHYRLPWLFSVVGDEDMPLWAWGVVLLAVVSVGGLFLRFLYRQRPDIQLR
ncbi:hypothetical protein [Neolewinella maritima]|uniref:hypothetical protein n=1 Tax=Neolewinella maritima TaxID=1383882 RepID=UPI001EE98195|nr:hypothetical protein [Neolewinella maritima]